MKKFLALLSVIILSLTIGVSCAQKADSYTVEEHIERITQRFNLKKQDITERCKIEIENFNVYPLYNENEEVKYYLIEFNPFGFTLVDCRDEPSPKLLYSCLGANISMYMLSHKIYGSTYIYDGETYMLTWSPYIADETNSQPYPDKDKIWILDDNGERIYHNKSPYYVTGNIDKRKYLIETEGAEYICAVKNDDKFINLMSGEEFIAENVDTYEFARSQASIFFPFYPDKTKDL